MKLSEMSNIEDKIPSSKRKTISESYDELKNCTSEELMAKLAKEIQSQKANGTFDYELLRNSIDKIKTYLPKQTYENMIRIIDGLKWT